ncbi:MAG: hypothetical protein JW825_04600 [Candidatus Methanofastidiosa archaeon]|nr:hypothetical protein [Candidatus Methanofastidiosa archaeon]
MSFSSIIENISDGDIEGIYDAIKGRIPLTSGLGLLEEIKGTMYLLRSQFLAVNDDPTMHRNFVSLYKNAEGQISALEGHFRQKVESGMQIGGEDAALKTMANLHLLINGLRSLCQTIDKGK